MLNKIKTRTPILALILFVFAVGYTFAANKVVVVPLGADAPASVWALVKTDGEVVAQSGGVSVNRSSTGNYWVDFGKDVTGHAIITSLKHPSRSSKLSVTICGGTSYDVTETFPCFHTYNEKNFVFVAAYTDTGSYEDTNFYIAALP